jgi:hypothetical protein
MMLVSISADRFGIPRPPCIDRTTFHYELRE